MRFVKKIIVFFAVIVMSGCREKIDISQLLPEYRLIHRVSDDLQKKYGVKLSVYGINNDLDRNYEIKKTTASFLVSYNFIQLRDSCISLEQARCLFVNITEALLQAINTDLEVRDRLDFYPFPIDGLRVSVHFVDENKIELGQGVCYAGMRRGVVGYDAYQIYEYKDNLITHGKHSDLLQEPYSVALEIATEQGCVTLSSDAS